MRALGTRTSFYLWIAVAMSVTAFAGFSFTYFEPLFRGEYPRVSPLVHVHGWTFFAWYLLLPAQAGLIRMRRVSIHRAIGLSSVMLGFLMILVGLIVSTVRIDMARAPDGDPFWKLMGLPIFSIWVLFTLFYAAAVYRRRRPREHKRFIVLASAVALSAATFRILVRILGFEPWVAIAGCLTPVLFIFAGMIHDSRRGRATRGVYLHGVLAMIGLIGGAFVLVMTPGGQFVERGLAWVGRLLRPLY